MRCIICNKQKKSKIKDILKYTCSDCIQNNILTPIVQIYNYQSKPLNQQIDTIQYIRNLRDKQKRCIKSFFCKDVRTVHKLQQQIQRDRKRLIKYYKENLQKYIKDTYIQKQ